MTKRKFLSLIIQLKSNTRTLINSLFLISSSSANQKKMGAVICKNSTKTEKSNCSKPTQPDVEYVEDVVCKDDDVKENEMKVFDLKDVGKVLLVRQNGKLNALGHKCVHYGAPLVQGALAEGRLRCQWHGACFNIETGDIEDFPGLDSLPCFQVHIESNKDVRIRAKRTELETSKRTKPMSKRDARESTCMVVIGGGPSGAVCVETLRQEGFTGRLVLVCKENGLPYDRVKVSKSLDVHVSKLELRAHHFYREHDIEVMLGVEAIGVNTERKVITLSNDTELGYDFVYVATGSKPRRLNVPGSDLPEVCVLRTFEDSHQVDSLLQPTSHVVCIGASFISMEAAAYCANKAKTVTVIGRGRVPFEPLFGLEIGTRVMKMFQEKGVTFIMNAGALECNDNGTGHLKSVKLTTGETISADICIAGIGSTLYTDFLIGSGVALNPDGSITVTERLETNVPGVYAGGDIAHAPVMNSSSDVKLATIGHYPLAHYHGRIAALNMLGRPEPVRTVPYFWTMLFGKSFRYAGHGRHEEIKVVGDLDALKYVAYHLAGDGRVVAVSSCQRDPVVSDYANFAHQGRTLYWKDLEADPFGWIQKK